MVREDKETGVSSYHDFALIKCGNLSPETDVDTGTVTLDLKVEIRVVYL